MVLVLVAGLFGVFGRGAVAHRSITSQDGSLTVEYDRFVRLHAPAALNVRVPSGRPLRVHLDDAYLENMEVLSIMPAPESQRATPGGVDFIFASQRDAGGRAVFRFKVQRIGSLAGTVTPGSDDGDATAVRIHQFAYP